MPILRGIYNVQIPPGGKSPKKQSVSSTELRLGEIKNKAATRVTFRGLDYLDRFFESPARTLHASVRD